MNTGAAALFVLIQNMTADKVLKEIQSAGGTVLKTSFDDTKEKALREPSLRRRLNRHPNLQAEPNALRAGDALGFQG